MNDVWLKKENQLRQMKELKKVMFAPCSNILISGEILLDDVLIGSSASDIESEDHSVRKTG